MKRGFRFRSWDAYFRIGRIAEMKGMCSNLADGRHILMWDFDNVPFKEVRYALKEVQERYCLSEIKILETKEDFNHIAYCFTAVDWKHALEIVLGTDHVCWNFWRLSVIRGYFTLRISEKGGRWPHLRAILPSLITQDVGINDLIHCVKYETGSVK